MELSHLIKILKKYSIFILGLAALGAVVGFFSTSLTSSGFQRTQTYIISDQSQVLQDDPNYYSENFYAEENLRNLTDTYVAILQSQDFQKDAVDTGDSLQVRKVAAQVIKITYSSSVEQKSKENLDKVVVKFNGKMADLEKTNPGVQLKPIGTSQAPVYSKLNSLTLVFAGAFIATAFALFVVFLKEYNNL